MSEQLVPESYWLEEFLPENPPVRNPPLAYFDKHLDCIRVLLRDCSFTEIRCNKWLTVLIDNHPKPNQNLFMGVTIKGIYHLFADLGIPMEGIQEVVTILNRVLEKYPPEDETVVEGVNVAEGIESVGQTALDTNITVNLAA